MRVKRGAMRKPPQSAALTAPPVGGAYGERQFQRLAPVGFPRMRKLSWGKEEGATGYAAFANSEGGMKLASSDAENWREASEREK